MQFYLPIAEVSVNTFVLLGMGGLVGILSGMFGVGGGFLLTPMLFFIGIPPAVAVATGADLVVASSVSAVMAHLRRRTVDLRLGVVLLVGGLLGSALGVQLVAVMARVGLGDLVVQMFYVVFLGAIGGLMLIESLRALMRSGSGTGTRRKHNWIHALPLKVKFRASGLYISVIPPAAVGLLVGVISGVMGIGGGFVMVPAMIYILGVPTKVVIGTSQFQIIFVSGFTTLMHAMTTHSVDMPLAVILLIGGVIGAQVGARLAVYLKAEQLRIALALLVLGVGLRIALELLLAPGELYSVDSGAGR